MDRRFVAIGAVVVALLVAVLLLVPGSVLGLVVSDSASFDAEPAEPSDAALSETAFEEQSAEPIVVEERIDAGGQSKTIVVTNHLRTYERSIDVQGEEFDAALFATVSTPAVEIATKPYNPVADMSHEELLTEFQSELDGEYSNLDDLEAVDEYELSVLGQSTTVTQFETTVTADGEEVTVYLYVTTVESGDDIVILVGGHPAPFAQERLSLFELMESVEHPAD